jgi:SAM-dependent methyltransferase
MALRTSQDFDEWFRKSGGDPWGYGGAFVQDRLDASLRFIARHVGPNFSGTFLELGAFNGDFTKRIAAKFPTALIAASDISPVAVEMARAALKDMQNVRLDCADLATFELTAEIVQPVKLLLLECIYYLPEGERGPAIERLVRVTGRPDVFVSCPITGGSYPTERWLMGRFRKLRYQCADAEALNYQPRWQPLVHRIGRNLASITVIRRHTARQVVYRFVPRR